MFNSKTKLIQTFSLRSGAVLVFGGLLAAVACAPSAQQAPGQTPAAAGTPAAGGAVLATQAPLSSEGLKSVDGLPSEYLDLSNWKLTLPFGEPHHPTEIKQPALKTFKKDGLFFLSDAGVVFHAHAGGVTTPNSSYPRTELREMANGGTERAAWSSVKGRHTMSFTAAITNTPTAKPHVVVGQVHDSKDDVVMIRLEREHLFVEGGGNNLGTLEPDYELGTSFSIILDVSEGRVRVYYNGEQTPRVDIERKVEGCYFKAGAYTQSNPARGDDEEAFGETVISQLSVQHSE